LSSLANHEEIQNKARRSIEDVLAKHDNEWCYDAVLEMTYIEQIIEESLRLNPPVATIHRVTTTEYKLSNGATIPKGTGVIIPNLAFQRDPEYFQDPLTFDPDRFSEEGKEQRNHPFSSLPFGEGEDIHKIKVIY